MRLRECEVIYRTRNVPGVSKDAIANSETVCRIMGPIARDRACESLWAVMLDARHRVTAIHEVSRGGISATHVEAADVFRAAVITHARALILVHNHPSGVCEPSGDDIELTQKLVQAGKLLGIAVLDHVIIGERDHHSMLDAGTGGAFK